MRHWWSLLLALGLCALSANALADLSGHWRGVGLANDSGSWKEDCASMQINLEVTDRDFKVSGTRFVCGDLTSQQKMDQDLQISEGNLFYQRQLIGTISQSAAHIQVTDADGHLSWWDFQLKDDGSLIYSDHQFLLHQEAYLEFHGTFSR